MKTKVAIHALVAVSTLMHTAIIRAQATNPPYLSQFPSVERVKSEIKGADEMDTAARQMGAFWQLREMIVKLAGPRFYRSPTSDENRLIGQYNQAYNAISQPYASYPDRPKWYQMHALYETDDGFLDQLLQKFFPAEFRTAYYRATGKQPPTQAKSGQPSVAAGSQPGGSKVTKADLLIATGFQWEKAKNYKVAISAYKDAIALQPNSKTAALAQKQIGMIYNTLESYQDAVPFLRESLRIDPNQHIASKELGFAYYKLKQYPNALAAFGQATRLKPDYAGAHYFLGFTYVRIGKKEEALQVYKRLLTLDKQDAQELYAEINKMK